MLVEDNVASDYFIYHEKKEYWMGDKGQDVEEDQRDLVSKGSDNKSVKNMIPRRTP